MQLFSQLGLKEKEANIYTTLIETGPLTVSGLSKKTGMHRPIVYKTLPSLLDKRLISLFPKGKRKLYVAENPDKLKVLLAENHKNIESMLSELKETHEKRDKKPLVKFIDGKKGIQSIFADLVDSLGRNEIFYRFSSRIHKFESEAYLPPNYRQARDKKGLQRFVITNEKTASRKKQKMERATKILPDKESVPFHHDVTQVIYGDKIAYIDYNSDTAMIVENKKIAEFQKKIFKSLYNRL